MAVYPTTSLTALLLLALMLADPVAPLLISWKNSKASASAELRPPSKLAPPKKVELLPPHGLAKLTTPDPCNRYDVNQCSVPFKDQIPVVEIFTPSCNRHDVCYSCGHRLGVSQKQCDIAFLMDMVENCRAQTRLKSPNRGKRSVDADDSSRHDTSVEILRTKQHLFDTVSEQAVGQNFAEFLARAETKEVEQAIDAILPRWTVLLNALHNEHASDEQALRAVEKFAKRNAARRQHHVSKREARVCSDIRSILKGERGARDTLVDCPDDYKQLRCLTSAQMGYNLVRTFGRSHFDTKSDDWCSKEFVPSCLPNDLILLL